MIMIAAAAAYNNMMRMRLLQESLAPGEVSHWAQ